jgi:hypothetical protein
MLEEANGRAEALAERSPGHGSLTLSVMKESD